MTKDDRVNRRLDNYSRILSSRSNIWSCITAGVANIKNSEEDSEYKNAEDKITISTKEKTKNDKGGK